MPPIETIMRRIGELKITDAINISRCGGDRGWQVSIRRPDRKSWGIGIADTMDEAFRKAASPPYGTSFEDWLKLAEDDDDDWRDLV